MSEIDISVGNELIPPEKIAVGRNTSLSDVMRLIDTQETGMVVDFGFLKELIVECVLVDFDHALFLNSDDVEFINFLSDKVNVQIIAGEPTAENIAKKKANKWACTMLTPIDIKTGAVTTATRR